MREKKWIKKDGKEQKISLYQINELLKDGWELGRIPHSKEACQNMRIGTIKSIEEKNGFCYPNFNINACEFFKQFDEENNTKGRYAVYGGGEFFIKELGYFPDYINFEEKIIMEWDEEYHFDENGYLEEKDVQRQKEIQAFYPDFEFRRIREKFILENC